MRLHDPLTDVLGGGATLRALRALVRIEQREFTGRELAAAAGLSHSQAQSALVGFERQGMVSRRVVGRAHAWSVEARNLLYQSLKGLLEAEANYPSRLERDIVEALREGPVERVVLFGSVATGQDHAASDIDLWVEVPLERDKAVVREQLFLLRDAIFERYGNPLAPIVHSRKEARALAESPLVGEIESKGRVLLSRGGP